jgi:hypothetical protein
MVGGAGLSDAYVICQGADPPAPLQEAQWPVAAAVYGSKACEKQWDMAMSAMSQSVVITQA